MVTWVTRHQVLLRQLVQRSMLDCIVGFNYRYCQESPTTTTTKLITYWIHHVLCSPIDHLSTVREGCYESIISEFGHLAKLFAIDWTVWVRAIR